MRKVIIAAVAAIAIAPGFLMVSAPVAHSAPCQGAVMPSDACLDCMRTYGGAEPAVHANCYNAVSQQAPANVPNDSCAYNLQPPNPSVGAYQACETARQATGGQ
jgi:hypothetical protein